MMGPFFEELIDARAEADNSPESDIGGSHDWCVVFLQALEARGFKLIGTEATPEMRTAGMEASPMVRAKDVGRFGRVSISDADAGTVFGAMQATAPTIADMLAAKPIIARPDDEEVRPL